VLCVCGDGGGGWGGGGGGGDEHELVLRRVGDDVSI